MREQRRNNLHPGAQPDLPAITTHKMCARAMFNPLDNKGIPLESQIRNWAELNVTPIGPEAVDPYTR
jgi:hypothetical protein